MKIEIAADSLRMVKNLAAGVIDVANINDFVEY
jgi:hypothetical protein